MNYPFNFRRWKWKNISIALFLQLCVTLAIAQVRITGKVTDNTGKGVPSISVAVRTTTIGTVTDNNGMYDLVAVLKPGSYVLEFSGVGFKTAQQSLSIGSSSGYTLDAQLIA